MIALEEGSEKRAEAEFVSGLLEQHHSTRLELALVASSASERMKGGEFPKHYSQFRARADRAGFEQVEVLLALGRIGIGFIDYCLIASKAALAREKKIFATLFPTHSYVFQKPEDLSDEQNIKKKRARWVNQMLDTQAFWAHENAARDVFVTSDRNFRRKLVGHPSFTKAKVLTPKEALELLQ